MWPRLSPNDWLKLFFSLQLVAGTTSLEYKVYMKHKWFQCSRVSRECVCMCVCVCGVCVCVCVCVFVQLFETSNITPGKGGKKTQIQYMPQDFWIRESYKISMRRTNLKILVGVEKWWSGVVMKMELDFQMDVKAIMYCRKKRYVKLMCQRSGEACCSVHSPCQLSEHVHARNPKDLCFEYDIMLSD